MSLFIYVAFDLNAKVALSRDLVTGRQPVLKEILKEGFISIKSLLCEIDIQRTKDGYYILNHDGNFKRVAKDKRKPEEMGQRSDLDRMVDKIKTMF